MPQQSLFKACKNIYRSGSSGTELVGDHEISFELYNQKSIYDNVEAIRRGEATGCTFGDSDQSKVVLVVGDVITIPSSFNLTPANPKKSMVIMCNTLINDGTISMTGKGPNILPHEWYILGKLDNYGESYDITIPAYANNGLPRKSYTHTVTFNGNNGNNGTNRQCGSGGQGSSYPNGSGITLYLGTSGSGSAFAGGGGGCGLDHYSTSNVHDCDTTYPMRGGSSIGGTWGADGGVGNPVGGRSSGNLTYRDNVIAQNFGVGGRLIIYCSEFINNGTISANGVNTLRTWTTGEPRCANYGGASGGGAVDLFYYALTTEGTITANGGNNFTYNSTPGKGGNGCVTLLNWDINKVVKPEWKKFSRDGWTYLFNQYVEKLNESEAL